MPTIVQGIEVKYSIRDLIRSSVDIMLSERVRSSTELAYTLRDRLRKGYEFRYDIKSTNRVSAAVELVYSCRLQASAEAVWSILPSLPVKASCELPYSLNGPVKSANSLVWNLTTPVQAATEVEYHLRAYNPVRGSTRLLWSLGGVSLVNVTDVPYLTIDGVNVEIASGDITANEGGYAWEGTFQLASIADYARFQRGGIFTATLYGETWVFEVDGKELSRSEPAQVSCRVMGVSPSARYAAPRAARQDYIWDTAIDARDAAEEAIGDSIDWDIVDWSIPAPRLAFSASDPITVVRQIVEAAGGILESNLDGTLRARERYPVSPKDYETATPDHTFTELSDIVSVSETYGWNDVYNKFRIGDTDFTIRDQIEWVEDYPGSTSGVIRVRPFPWRTSVTLEHTGDGTVTIGTPSIVIMEMEEEIVEVLRGQGRTSRPIYQLLSYEWEATDLGGIVFNQDTEAFAVVGPAQNSVVRIVYRTRFIDYPVVCGSGRPTQFLLKSAKV